MFPSSKPVKSVALAICPLIAGLLAGPLASTAAEAFWPPFGPSRSDATGADLYRAKCSGCHAPDRNKYGPSHHDLVGRVAGSQPGYRYSAALARSGLIWTPSALDAWLTNPEALVPGTRMTERVRSPLERQRIITYLVSTQAAAATPAAPHGGGQP